MTYLTSEWEVKSLMKKSNKSLSAEADYLHKQWRIKCNLLYAYGNDIAKGKTPQIPLWMIEADIQSLNEQLVRVIDEMKRRFVP